MTTPTPEPQESTPPADPGASPDDSSEPDGEARGGNAEAARRRAQLRQVEAERDEIAARLEVAHRQVVASMLQTDTNLPWLHNAADLFDIGGVAVADLLGEDGQINAERLTEALTTLNTERPYLFGQRPELQYSLYESLSREMAPAPVAGDLGAAWQAALKANG
jgi:hypothetical protein